MTYEYIILFLIGLLIGAILNRSKEDREQERIYEERYRDYEAKITYYKKLTRELAEENAEYQEKAMNPLDLAKLLEVDSWYKLVTREEVANVIREQQEQIEALKEQLNFITNINRLGLGVQKENGLTSSEIEKVWLSIEEQKDDNFHYGWKKCEQYYGIRKAQEK